MSTNSSIQWTEATWNPVTGCTPVSSGCLNCYAARDAHRMAGNPNPKISARYKGLTVVRDGRPVFNGEVRLHEDRLPDPLRWRKPRRVFVNSQSDLFHEAVPFEFIDRVFAVMALCPQHTFQILTKRPERMAEYLNCREQSSAWSPTRKSGDEAFRWKTPCDKVYTIAREMNGDNQRLMGDRIALIWPLPNVWLGTSVEDQKTADERIPHLLRVPAVVRFLSCEPLLGPVSLRVKCPPEFQPILRSDRINWVIAGGESGPHARPCNVAWLRSIRDQCKAAGVPLFVKQLGRAPMLSYAEATGAAIRPQLEPELLPLKLADPKGGDMAEWPEDLRVRELPTC